eukprot:SAG31_NODE_26059_length_449_cov_0.897143_1_plen_55_part_10
MYARASLVTRRSSGGCWTGRGAAAAVTLLLIEMASRSWLCCGTLNVLVAVAAAAP